jgi:hypothetical protein
MGLMNADDVTNPSQATIMGKSTISPNIFDNITTTIKHDGHKVSDIMVLTK